MIFFSGKTTCVDEYSKDSFFSNYISNRLIEVTYSQLVDIGFFLGNDIKKTFFLSSWLVYGTKEYYVILDLVKNILHYKIIYGMINSIVDGKQPI